MTTSSTSISNQASTEMGTHIHIPLRLNDIFAIIFQTCWNHKKQNILSPCANHVELAKHAFWLLGSQVSFPVVPPLPNPAKAASLTFPADVLCLRIIWCIGMVVCQGQPVRFTNPTFVELFLKQWINTTYI